MSGLWGATAAPPQKHPPQCQPLLSLTVTRVKFHTNWLILHLAKEVERIYVKITGNSLSVLADAGGLPPELDFKDASSKTHIGLGE